MISKNEEVIVWYSKRGGPIVGAMSINQTGNVYFFYEFDGRDFKKLGKGSNPLELEKKFNINKRMGMVE